MQIEHIRVVDIKPYPHNPREIPETAVAELARYIDDVGFRFPIHLDKAGEIIAGHRRYLAAIRLGFEVVPCIIHDDLTEDEIKGLRIADNKIAESTSWSKSLLADELASLDGIIEAQMLGFDDAEIDKIFDIAKEDEPLDTGKPEDKQFHVCQSGEVWDLGPHQLTIGAKNPAQADGIIKAWQKKAKDKATLNGQAFSEIEKGRKFEAEGAKS